MKRLLILLPFILLLTGCGDGDKAARACVARGGTYTQTGEVPVTTFIPMGKGGVIPVTSYYPIYDCVEAR